MAAAARQDLPRRKPNPGHGGSRLVPDGATTASSTDDRAAREELAKLEGTWEVIEATESGERMTSEKVRGLRITFSKDIVKFTMIGDDAEQAFRARPGSG